MSEEKASFNRVPDHKKLSDFCLKHWDDIQLYTQWQQAEKQFVLHDGPPYANGDIHLGHALNKTLKDCINRFTAMLGFRPHFITGWDCNGLPIEAKVEANFGNELGLKMSQIKESKAHINNFREECKKYASHWIEVQRESFKQLGVIADSNVYTTIDLKNQLSIIELIHKFAKAGLVYRDLKPVLWSCEEGTALAESEVEYLNKKSQAIDVAFHVFQVNSKTLSELKKAKDLIIPIWTTTPWTIPANRAIAYNKNIKYIIAESEKSYFILAEELFDEFINRTKIILGKVMDLSAADLEGIICLHPIFKNEKSPLLNSNHVTDDQGTGFVHIAPDYGIDDFKLCKENKISCVNYLNDSGHFLEEMPEDLSFLSGKFYVKAESLIINTLSENTNLLSYEQIEHQYPHSWRSKKPLIYRATNQWFINIKKIQEECIQEVEKVEWLPSSSKERFKSILISRSEWCISRQRLWGTPIAFFYHKDTGAILTEDRILESTLTCLSNNGINYWWNEKCAKEILGDKRDYIPVYDIVDVWFESGASQRYILQASGKYPADMYLEGSDQHRGWFQSSIINGFFETHRAPFKCVKTHGFLVDKSGKKMSKSSGNGLSPSEIIEKNGPDVLRLSFLRQSTDGDLNWSENQIKEVEIMYFKIRNTIKFLLNNSKKGNFTKIDSPLEGWVLHQVYKIQELINHLPTGFKQMQPWDIHVIVHKVYQLCDITLSKLYFDIRKDVLYWENDTSEIKKQVQHVLWIVLDNSLKWLAPVVPFMAEEAWQIYKNESSQSIHIEKFQQNLNEFENLEAYQLVENLLKIRTMINAKIEPLRAEGLIKTTLDAKIVITCKRNSILLKPNISALLESIVIVSGLESKESVEGESDGSIIKDIISVEVFPASEFKCIRCKKRVSQMKQDLCLRCFMNKG